MGYSSDSQVRYYLSSLGSDAGGFGTDVVGTYVMSEKISDADNIINMKLSKRYNTPFGSSSIPPAVTTISKILSGWFSLRSVFSNEIPKALEFVEEDYNKAMKLLDQLQKKEIDLPSGTESGAVVTEKGSATIIWSSTKNYTPIFDLDDDLNWKVDSDRIEDIAENRE